MNFSINTNFQNFDNSISDFNKIFSQSLEKQDENLNSLNASFNDVLNSTNTDETEKSQALDGFIGLDTINAQKIETSPIKNLADEIGSGLSNSINELNTTQRQAEQDFETFASGGDISVHDVMISAQKSNLAMQMAIQLRNQAINTYNEFKNMSI